MTQAKPPFTLSDAFTEVVVTPEQAAHLLQVIARDFSDGYPDLTQALLDGVDTILGSTEFKKKGT